MPAVEVQVKVPAAPPSIRRSSGWRPGVGARSPGQVGTRDTPPGLAAKEPVANASVSAGQLRDVLRHQAPGTHDRQGGPGHGRLHLVGVPFMLIGDVLVRLKSRPFTNPFRPRFHPLHLRLMIRRTRALTSTVVRNASAVVGRRVVALGPQLAV